MKSLGFQLPSPTKSIHPSINLSNIRFKIWFSRKLNNKRKCNRPPTTSIHNNVVYKKARQIIQLLSQGCVCVCVAGGYPIIPKDCVQHLVYSYRREGTIIYRSYLRKTYRYEGKRFRTNVCWKKRLPFSKIKFEKCLPWERTHEKNGHLGTRINALSSQTLSCYPFQMKKP